MASSGKPKKPAPGFLVTFEGLEGSGKSTQLNLLADYLTQKGYAVLKTREPGGTRIGDAIRSIFLDPENAGMTPKTELYLILAARAQHVAERIWPAIKEGKIVLCDRFLHTTVAYQGYGRGLNSDFVSSHSISAAEKFMPRIVFFLDVDVPLALSRVAQRGRPNRFDRERREFYEKVRQGYIKISSKFKTLTRRIDASRPVEVVAEEIRHHIDELIKERHHV